MDHLHRSRDRKSALSDFLHALKRATGFESVGLRLRDGEDFPYYETLGFPPVFVESERFLCARDSSGVLLRDPAGRASLECMCGNVLSGRTDASLPFFTEYGSFWTNSTTDLLASTHPEYCQGRTRNRCNSAGYESLALIPFFHGGMSLGLLQLNDGRRGMFTPEKVDAFERLCFSLGMYLGQMLLEDQVREFHLEKDAMLAEIHHRVKNNMQIISSLLHLQSVHCKHAEDIHVFRDSEKRIKCIAAIQDRVYQLGSPASVMLDTFLPDLLRELVGIHGGASHGVRMVLDVGRVSLDVGKAIPCSMVMGELVSNALIHAFEGKADGSVTVSLNGDGGDYIRLSVADTGIGMPEGFNVREPSTFGLRVVAILASQLGATVEAESSPGLGTSVSLRFRR
jgi:two-component sensor histidine kinase